MKKSRKPSPKQITVVMEQEHLNEAVYIDGAYHSCDTTIYAGVLAEIADGQPVYLEHMTVESRPHDSQWPKTLSELTEVKEE